ncbi:MAG TPA: FHA domain-containing protein, partial [Candidatus Obscuribacterales bacterium]
MRKLTEAERKRADKLAQAFKNRVPLDEPYNEAMNSLGTTQSALKHLGKENEAYWVFHKLADNTSEARVFSQRLFGSETLPPDVAQVLENWRASGKPLIPDEASRRILVDALKHRELQLVPQVRPRYQAYLATYHELEAHVIPRLLPAQSPDTPAVRAVAMAPEVRSEVIQGSTFTPASADAMATFRDKDMARPPRDAQAKATEVTGSAKSRAGSRPTARPPVGEKLEAGSPPEPVDVFYDLLKGDNYEYYFASNERFQALAGTQAYEYLKYRHELERVGIGIQVIEDVFPALCIETSRAEAIAKILLEPGGIERLTQSPEEFIPRYLWRNSSGQSLGKEQVLALVREIDTRLKGRALDLQFNHKTAKKLADRIVPPDRSIGFADITEESAQFAGRRVRPMDVVLDQGMEFRVDEAHVGLLRDIARQQENGFIPEGFRAVTDERTGLLRYEVTGWRAASPEERSLPLAELTKNLKIVDYGFTDANGQKLLGKISLGTHDGNDHLRAFRALEQAGLLAKDSSGRGYRDLLQQLGNFPAKDMFNRESELIATVAYNWRAFPEMHPSYDPPVKLAQIAEWLSKNAADMSENQRHALAYIRSLIERDPSGMSEEARLLRHVFSAVGTELNEQSRKTGLSFLINPKGVTSEIITPTHPEYVALIIDVTRSLGDPGTSEYLQKLNLRLEEYLRAVAEGSEQGRGKFRLRDLDVQSSPSHAAGVPQETQDWLARHPGFSTRRAPIRDWDMPVAAPHADGFQDESTKAFSLKGLIDKAKQKLGLGETPVKSGVVDRSQWRPEDEPKWYADYGDEVDELAPDVPSEPLPAAVAEPPFVAPERVDASSPAEAPPVRTPRPPEVPPRPGLETPALPSRKVIDRVGGLELGTGRTIRLGSGANADIQIGSSAIDYHHAEVRVDREGNVFVRDLGSVNGTVVLHADGSKTAVPPNGEIRLQPDDQRILLGDHPVSITSKEVAVEAPRVSPEIAAQAHAPERVFYSQSTAPKRVLDEIAGVRLRRGRELTIGRAEGSDIKISDDMAQVSKRHARVRMDAEGRVYVTDVGSTNGTYIRHADGTTEKLTANVERELRPDDRLLLSDHELSVGRLEPSFTVKIGGRTVNLRSGEAAIGDGRWGVGPDDAKLVLREDGLYLKVTGDVPIYLNRQRVPAGSEIPLRPRDSVGIGEVTRFLNGQRQGEWLQLVETATDAVPRPRDAAEIGGARDQSTEFAQQDEISDRLEDGFRSGGRRNSFDANGDFTKPVNRHAFVVNRKDDALLREVIDDVKRRFGARDAQGRFKKLDPTDPEYPAQVQRILNNLTPYVHDLFEPPGWSFSGQLDDWDDLFKTHKAGGHVLLGEYIKQGKGVCIQQAVTLKVLCDELGIDATLVRGAGLARQPDTINHAWVEVRLPGEQEPRVYDPRGLVMGKRAGDQSSAYHKRGLVIQQELAARQQEIQAIKQAWRDPKPPAEVYIGDTVGGRRIDIGDGETVEIGRDMVSGSPEQKGKVSRAHADIVRRDGSLWLRDKSSNGTYVNGVRVTAQDGVGGWVSIGPGDRVTLGGPDGPELHLTSLEDEATRPMIRLPDRGDRTGIFQMPVGSKRPVVKMEHGPVHEPIAIDAQGKPIYQPLDGLLITVDGRKFPMKESDGGWWKPVRKELRSDIGESAIKVHVYVSPDADLNDLARLQEVLIPRLFDDPELASLVQSWKTLNPEIAWKGVDVDGSVRSTGQGAKAFTIYAASPEQALKIQKKIDQILAEHPELRLEKPFAGGNVDIIRGDSNRVGIVRDHFKRSPDSTRGELRIQIDHAVYARILNDPDLLPYRADLIYGGPPRLTGEGYRKLEDKLGLMPGTLRPDREGLTMRVFDYDRSGGYGDLYVTEKGAEAHARGETYQVEQTDGSVKTVRSEGYTNRPAVYKIYESYGADPAMVAAGVVEPSVVRGKGGAIAFTINAKGIRSDFEYDTNGQITEIRLSYGSRYTRLDEHTWRITDSKGVRDLKGRFSLEDDGTLVWAPQDGEPVALKLNGQKEKRLASQEPPSSSTYQKSAPSEVKADTEPVSPKDIHDEVTPVLARRAAEAGDAPPEVIRIGDRELSLGAGDQKIIGRSEESDLRIDDRAISRNHALIGRDQKGFYIVDLNSSNGTYIKRQGSNKFERIAANEQVRINLPGDEIRLGDPKKPELSLERLEPTKDAWPQQGYMHPVRVRTPGKTDHIPENTEIIVGSDPLYGWAPAGSDPSWNSVDSEHAGIGRDANGLYVRDWNSQHGTYLKREGEASFKRIPPGEKVYLQPGDTIRLGEETGPEVSFAKAAKVEGSDDYRPLKDKDGKVIEYGSQRVFEVDGKQYKLERRARDRAKWFYPEDPRFKGGLDTAIKVHVNVEDDEMLGKLQAILIPALHDDPDLQSMVSNWKTMDPRYGVNEPDAIGPRPNGLGQNAKGFTIYARSAADALKIVDRIDEILSAHPELVLSSPLGTGNVDVIPPYSKSKRVGSVRDRFEPGVDANGRLAIRIDEPMQAKIRAYYPQTPGETPDAWLRRLEQDTGLYPGSLQFDKHGDMILIPSRWEYTDSNGELQEHVGAKMAPGGNAYADEGSAGKIPGELTDRPALYA